MTAHALFQAGNDRNQRAQWIRNDRAIKRRDTAALELLNQAQLQPGTFGLDELNAMANTPMLSDFTLIMIDAERSYAPFTFGRGSTHIAILYDDHHYDTVNSLPALYGTDEFCYVCYKPYGKQGHHHCPKNRGNYCSSCRKSGCAEHADAYAKKQSPEHHCKDCNRFFYGPTCLLNHTKYSLNGRPITKKRLSVCKTCARCATCHVFLRTTRQIQKHKCGWTFCKNCKQSVLVDQHQCYIQVLKDPKEEDNNDMDMPSDTESCMSSSTETEEEEQRKPILVFFDLECMQGPECHIPNLCVALCDDETDYHTWYGEDCVEQFIDFLLQLSDDGQQPLTCIAHNFKGYDSYPIIDVLNTKRLDFQQLHQGSKVLNLTFGIRINMIDSASFFAMPLRKLPKTFGIQGAKKGFFPHLFNIPGTNQAYVGPMPDKHYYMPEVMKPGDDLEEFEQWYQEQIDHHVEFNFHEDLIAYCKSDVYVLQQACLKFKHDFEDKMHFCPFSRVTIASACNTALRMHFLKGNTIGVEPLQGWRRNINHSNVSLEWLLWCQHSCRKTIQHARAVGEYRIPRTRYSVDGFIPNGNRGTCYEFNGCWCHGCPKCYPDRTQPHPRLLGRSMQDVYNLTLKKEQHLKELGYQVITMWECTWAKMKQDHEGIKTFVQSLDLKPPLNPRDAFYGGRTNAACLYATANNPEDPILYRDFKSVYPWVNKNGEYPLGHPQIHYNLSHLNIGAFFGVACVTILPPDKLLFPVLPMRYDGRLIFPLCHTCVEENLNKPMLQRVAHCHHTPNQRQLTGTWCTPEIEAAIAHGYTLKKIHEVWDFPDRDHGVFKDYVNMWLKIKEEASGYPKWCKTQEDKEKHIQNFYDKEGIRLDPDKIEKNEGLRALAKLMLNSMWGKFGQQNNKKQVRHFTSSQDLVQFLDTQPHDISYISLLDENKVEVHYKLDTEDVMPQLTTNVFIAAFTTMWARLRLLRALDYLQERTLYYDTDSVIHRGKDIEPPLGDALGDFTNELGPDEFITEFCSGGPKNYGYTTNQDHTECKVKGFSLNAQGAAQLNYQVLRNNTLQELQEPLQDPRKTAIKQDYTIERNAKKYKLLTKEQTKLYQLVYCKRVVDPQTFMTYPYGYFQLNEQDLQNAELLLSNDSDSESDTSSSVSSDVRDAANILMNLSNRSSSPELPPTPGKFLE